VLKRALSILCAWTLTCPGLCETVYVTDVLRLGLQATSDIDDRAFDTLLSGTELDVLERVPSFARVRTADGREGWVRSAYLVTDKPAQLRLLDLEAASAEAALHDGVKLPASWVVGALVLALALGFTAGWWCLDALLRRRHGGFRLY
jgi:hypothetical protein